MFFINIFFIAVDKGTQILLIGIDFADRVFQLAVA